MGKIDILNMKCGMYHVKCLFHIVEIIFFSFEKLRPFNRTNVVNSRQGGSQIEAQLFDEKCAWIKSSPPTSVFCPLNSGNGVLGVLLHPPDCHSLYGYW